MSDKIACFSAEQQRAFDALNAQQKKYVLYRGQGMDMSKAYRLAGYTELSHAGQMGYKLEKQRHPEMAGLIATLKGVAHVNYALDETSKLSKAIDKKAEEIPKDLIAQAEQETALPTANDMSAEEARTIQFLRKVASGEYATERITKTYDKDGNLTGRKVERVKDVEVRLKAQKEVARMLGVRDVIDVGRMQAGAITINIVDCAKKDLDDKDKVELNKADYDVAEDDGGDEKQEPDGKDD